MKTQNKYKKTLDLQIPIDDDNYNHFSMKSRNFGHRVTQTFHAWLAECERHDAWHERPELEQIQNLANVVDFLDDDYCDLQLELDNEGESDKIEEFEDEILEQEKLEKDGWLPSLDLQFDAGSDFADWRLTNGDGYIIAEGFVDVRLDDEGDYLSLFAEHLLNPYQVEDWTARFEKVTEYSNMAIGKKL